MARSASVSIENNFSRGLITEVTGVNSPENSVSETKNIVYDRRGRAHPRYGFDYEPDYISQPVAQDGERTQFLWETFSEGGSKTFLVVQFGSILRFFDTAEGGSISAGLKPFSVNLLTYKSSNFSDTTVARTPVSFTSGKSYLFVAHSHCSTIYVKYNPDTDTISVNTITIKIRDLEGVEDGLAVDTRPDGSISVEHFYNLYNQGWGATAQKYGEEQIIGVSVLDSWRTLWSYWPSNADVWWYYLAANPQQGTKPDPSTGLEAFDPRLIQAGKSELYGTNRPAAKGHFIINALSTNRTSMISSAVPEQSSGGYRPSVVAFFTGRAFYSGVNSQDYASTIYFTQIIQSDEDLEKCYQSNDPTSREAYDLLSSDGGLIKIQDVASIIDLRVIGESLYVFASNGVWSISGSDNGPFKATDYVVKKVSSFPAIAKQSIVDVGGVPVWWNYEGIFTLKSDQTGFSQEVTSLTLSTIQSFYDDISPNSKMTAKGAFNDQLSLVYWLYREDSDDYVYDRILVLDVSSGAFYPLELPASGPSIAGVIAVRSIVQVSTSEEVTTSAGPVFNSLGQVITVSVAQGLAPSEKIFKFLTIDGGDVTFSQMVDETYLDWGTDGYEYYFVTGYRIRGDLVKKFQTNYLTVVSETVADASCYAQGLWDYTNNPDSGRYTNPQQVTRSKNFRDYQISRVIIRGNGRSLQFRFFGEEGKPFVIVGWSGFETTNDLP